MNYQDLNEVRRQFDLTTEGMSKLLGVDHGTYRNWGNQGRTVPLYIQYSVEALQLLPRTRFRVLLKRRGADDF